MGIRLSLLQPCVMNVDIPVLSQDLPVINIVIKQEEKPQPKLYKIVAGDNLTKIANAHQTSVERLWAANTQLADPNTIEVNQELKIPLNDEVLPERALPVTVEVFKDNESINSPPSGGFSSGNTYTYGYCTWYVKNRRPDLPNNLGNADTWTYRAAAQGYATGYTPRAGAVAQLGMHVAYVESVGDATMTISEMNHVGWNIQSSRTISSAGWSFIY